MYISQLYGILNFFPKYLQQQLKTHFVSVDVKIMYFLPESMAAIAKQQVNGRVDA